MATPATTLLLHLDDPAGADHLLPKDAAGNLDDLNVEAGITMPVVADGFSGRARNFVAASTRALLASDKAGKDTLETRDCTVRVLTSLRYLSAASWPRALYVRGLGDGTAAQRYALGLEMEKLALPVSPVALEMRLFWHDSAGALKTQPGGTFHPQSESDFLLLTATRRWVSSTSVVCRYYVNEHLIGEVTTADGDIAGATTGTTSVGARKNAGAWGRFWDGIVDQVQVLNYEMSHEEVKATWERLTVHQPAGVELLAAMAPPGSGWLRDASGRLGKLLRLPGILFGYALARARELGDNWLPDRTYVDELPRWETLHGLSARPLESLDTRRSRVVAFASRDNGYAPPQIQSALAELLALASTDVQILEFKNRIDEDFATLSAERWHTWPAGVWASSGGQLVGTSTLGADMRWDGSVYSAYRCMMPMSKGTGRVVVLSKFTAYTAFTDTLAGLFLYNWRTNNALWFGIRNNGSNKLGYVSYKDGVQGAFTAVLDPAPATPFWLKIVKDPDVAGRYVLSYSTAGPETGFTDLTVNDLLADAEWAGYAFLGFDSAAAGAATITADDFVLITPNGTRPCTWYAYRDPLLAGSPDMVGANALLKKLKPAHTHAAAVTSKSLKCDSLTDGGCDRGPMGGL